MRRWFDWHPLVHTILCAFFAAFELLFGLIRLDQGSWWAVFYLSLAAFFAWFCYTHIRDYSKDVARWRERNTPGTRAT